VTNTDVLILGAGPAGLTAGLYAVRAGAKTVIIESLAPGGSVNLTPDIENFPGFIKIGGAELGTKMLEQTESAGARVVYDEVEDIDFDKRTVKTAEATYKYNSLIIATGVSPRKLGLGNEEDFIGNGIHFCGLCDGQFYRGKDIVVVGGGNHAVEEVIYLSAIAKSVTIINNTDKFIAQEVLVNKIPAKAKVYHSATVTEIIADKKITGVKLKDGTKIACDGIFVAIGRVPNTNLFKDKLDLSRDGYLVVNNEMRTSNASVFAAGDVVQKQIRQVITACADGAIAATFATRK
jgi:thioredoxin reductase (NADPH)